MNSQVCMAAAGVNRKPGIGRSLEWTAAFMLGCLLQIPLAHGANQGVAATPTVHVVTMQNMQFVPATLTVRPGDKVRWVNKDLVTHTASATGSQFDSGDISAGASWTYTVQKTGTLGYVCRYHPGMQARLTAQ
ncbi:cupredoxin domain-containing protein [Advenella kashmirensis]